MDHNIANRNLKSQTENSPTAILSLLDCGPRVAFEVESSRMRLKIKEIRTRLGLKQKDLVEATGLSNPYLSALETGNVKKSPSIETLTTIAEALGVRIGDLFDDAKPVTIVGTVGSSAKVFPIDSYEKGGTAYRVVCPTELSGMIGVAGVLVESDSLLPVYQEGDVLFYAGNSFGEPSKAIGSICICEDVHGDAWVRYVKSGSEPSKFHLISLNPLVENMFDIQLKWANPVELHWPKAMVEMV